MPAGASLRSTETTWLARRVSRSFFVSPAVYQCQLSSTNPTLGRSISAISSFISAMLCTNEKRFVLDRKSVVQAVTGVQTCALPISRRVPMPAIRHEPDVGAVDLGHQLFHLGHAVHKREALRAPRGLRAHVLHAEAYPWGHAARLVQAWTSLTSPISPDQKISQATRVASCEYPWLPLLVATWDFSEGEER